MTDIDFYGFYQILNVKFIRLKVDFKTMLHNKKILL